MQTAIKIQQIQTKNQAKFTTKGKFFFANQQLAVNKSKKQTAKKHTVVC